MSESGRSKARIARREKVPRYYATHRTYLPYLMRDFAGRCAYSMQHHVNAGGETAMHIDHFNPHLAKHLRNRYENLFLATAHCNGSKLDFWPSKSERRAGIRFLNPCEEHDYGVHLFEDPITFELWSDTPAGRYHIRVLKLNAPHLIRERRMRHEFRKTLDAKGTFEFDGSMRELPDAVQGWQSAREWVESAIPVIVQKTRPRSG